MEDLAKKVENVKVPKSDNVKKELKVSVYYLW
jgi:hypothetical protein